MRTITKAFLFSGRTQDMPRLSISHVPQGIVGFEVAFQEEPDALVLRVKADREEVFDEFTALVEQTHGLTLEYEIKIKD